MVLVYFELTPDYFFAVFKNLFTWMFVDNDLRMLSRFSLQYLTKKLGVDPIVYGYLETTFAILQLVGGPLFGRFGDLFGGRYAFLLAFASAAASYGILGISYNVPMVFLSRLPVIFMHAAQGM